MPAPDGKPNKTAPADQTNVFQLPPLDSITHVSTAKRTYSLASYQTKMFIPAADARARAEAVKNGADPLAVRLYGSDVLVLIKSDGDVRIIPLHVVVEFTVEKKKASA